MDSKTKSSGLERSKKSLDEGKGALGRTLGLVYDNKDTIAYAFWNDEEPDGHTHGPPTAHAKGALGFNSSGGFYLTHSVPQFPDMVANGYSNSWQIASHVYGQSFLCISLAASGIKDVTKTLLVDDLSIYDSSLPPSMEDSFPSMSSLLNREKAGVDTMSTTFKSRGGKSFLRISKSGHWSSDKDSTHFYENLVAPTLKSTLATETWQNGVGHMNNACKRDGYKYDVLNINFVKPSPSAPGWESTRDHSKWAVTLPETKLTVEKLEPLEGNKSSNFIYSLFQKFIAFRMPAEQGNETKDSNIVTSRHLRSENRKRNLSSSNGVACIGDINRQTGQMKRGGGTVCLLDLPDAYQALYGMASSTEKC
eukprot:g13.t1